MGFSRKIRLGNLAMRVLKNFSTSDDQELKIRSIKLLSVIAIEMLKYFKNDINHQERNQKKNFENQLIDLHEETIGIKIDILTFYGLVRRMVRFATENPLTSESQSFIAIKW